MRKYKSVEVPEKRLEDMVRQGADLIEDGLRYIDHQRSAGRGPLDVLMVDSGNALVVAELKVVEDDAMLVQGIDYYDYISKSIEGIARVYKDFDIAPNQTVRLFLIAPSFSVSLLNRCKWIDIPISLFIYKCIEFEDTEEIMPVFWEVTLPPEPPPPPPPEPTLSERLGYITDPDAREMAKTLIEEIESWDSARILIEPIKYDISLKISGRVFSYIGPRRKYFIVSTFDNGKKWANFKIYQKEDLVPVKDMLKANIERLG